MPNSRRHQRSSEGGGSILVGASEKVESIVFLVDKREKSVFPGWKNTSMGHEKV